jgi:hypothetical protein
MMRYIHVDVTKSTIIVIMRNGLMVATFTDEVKPPGTRSSNDFISGRMHIVVANEVHLMHLSRSLTIAVQTYLEAINLVWSRRLCRR